MKFIENNTYTLQTDKGLAPYNSVRVVCTYVEDNTVWLKSDSYPMSDTTLLYKYNRKSGKLYVFNTKVQAYDLVEGSLSEYDVMARYKPKDVTISYGFMGD